MVGKRWCHIVFGRWSSVMKLAKRDKKSFFIVKAATLCFDADA